MKKFEVFIVGCDNLEIISTNPTTPREAGLELSADEKAFFGDVNDFQLEGR